MRPLEVRRRAQAMHDAGLPFKEIVAALGVPGSTICNWLYGERGRASRVSVQRSSGACVRCTGAQPDDAWRLAYAYLLGQYLGDGHIVRARVPLLAVYCDERYPGIIAEIGAAMLACGARTIRHRQRAGCIAVVSYWTHWPCLFPQSGPGLKHKRRIEFVPWQQAIADEHPGPLVRGLIHADGCRVVNRVTTRGKRYEYPRYFFSNESTDILGICGDALDRLGCAWRFNRRDSISVARAEAVAILDAHVGPKK